MTGPWRITPYTQAEGAEDSDVVRTWTEYAIEDAEGRPICTGIMLRDIAEQIAVLGRVPDAERAGRLLKLFGVGSPPPTTENLVDRWGLTLESLLAEVKHLRSDLRERTAGAASSVQLEQGAKEVRLTVKVYDGSPVGEIGDEALEQFGRLFRLIEQHQRNNWVDTLDSARDRVAEGVGK